MDDKIYMLSLNSIHSPYSDPYIVEGSLFRIKVGVLPYNAQRCLYDRVGVGGALGSNSGRCLEAGCGNLPAGQPAPDRDRARVVRLHESQLHRQVEGSLLKGRQFPEVSRIRDLVDFAHQACHVLAEVRGVVRPAPSPRTLL